MCHFRLLRHKQLFTIQTIMTKGLKKTLTMLRRLARRNEGHSLIRQDRRDQSRVFQVIQGSFLLSLTNFLQHLKFFYGTNINQNVQPTQCLTPCQILLQLVTFVVYLNVHQVLADVKSHAFTTFFAFMIMISLSQYSTHGASILYTL